LCVFLKDSNVRFDVSGFVPKAPIFALETRLNQPNTDYQNKKNKTISNYSRKAQAPTAKLKAEITSEPSKITQ